VLTFEHDGAATLHFLLSRLDNTNTKTKTKPNMQNSTAGIPWAELMEDMEDDKTGLGSQNVEQCHVQRAASPIQTIPVCECHLVVVLGGTGESGGTEQPHPRQLVQGPTPGGSGALISPGGSGALKSPGGSGAT
jgi:hypothetical protein